MQQYESSICKYSNLLLVDYALVYGSNFTIQLQFLAFTAIDNKFYNTNEYSNPTVESCITKALLEFVMTSHYDAKYYSGR